MICEIPNSPKHFAWALSMGRVLKRDFQTLLGDILRWTLRFYLSYLDGLPFKFTAVLERLNPNVRFHHYVLVWSAYVTVRNRQNHVCFLVDRFHALAGSGNFSCSSRRSERWRLHFLQKSSTKHSGYVCTFCTNTVRRLLMGWLQCGNPDWHQ